MTVRLAARFVVVTGAAGSIGRAILARLTAEGATVAALDLRAVPTEQLEALAVPPGAVVHGGSVDVTDRSALEAAAERLEARLGRPPDAVVAAAGVQGFVSVEQLPLDELERVMRVNVGGPLVTSQVFAPRLRRAGGGSVVVLASVQGRIANPESAHYAASKAAALSLTRSLAVALAPDRIRVNAVAPGMIDSDMWDEADRELARLRGVPAGEPRRQRLARVPLGRPGTTEDVAAAVAYLVSDDSAYITGECLHVSGGDLML